MTIKKRPTTFFAIVENGYGQFGFTCPFPTRAELIAHLMEAMGPDGEGISYGDVDTDDVDRCEVQIIEVASSVRATAEMAGVKIVIKGE